jgi:hypothetical protein
MNLSASALKVEPYYGVEVLVDETQLTPVRFVVLKPVPYAGAAAVTKWRYLVQTPLAQIGTYVFSIQAVGTTGSVVTDSTPWPNFGFAPKASFDLSGIVTTRIEGLAFDDNGRLWVWDGAQCTALEMHYNGFVVDQESQAIYLTDVNEIAGLVIDGVNL